jgi:hypothetical protein
MHAVSAVNSNKQIKLIIQQNFLKKCWVFVKKKKRYAALQQFKKKRVWNLCEINAFNLIANKIDWKIIFR